MILERLKNYARERACKRQIVEVRIGLCYTVVLLDDGHAGMAYTFRKSISDGCTIFQQEQPLAGRAVEKVLDYITSHELLERTVGIATANAIVNTKREGMVEGDVLAVLRTEKEDRVGMVGFFGPLIPKLKKSVRELLIFEKQMERSPGLYPEEKAFEILPSCTIAILTATSIINSTIDALLEASRNCRKIAILGATTPLVKEIFKDRGVSLLSGVIIVDSKSILQIVGEGGGMRSFKGCIKKVNLPLGEDGTTQVA